MNGQQQANTAADAPSIARAIEENSMRDPAKIAVEDRFREISYARLSKRIRAVAAMARQEPLMSEGHHCGILSKNRIEYIELVAGLPEAGVAAATINPRLNPLEIKQICNDAKVNVLFVDLESEKAISGAHFDTVEKVIVFGDQYERWLAQARTDISLGSVDQELPFTIPYTSGTTGKPKGVLVSMRSRVLTFFGMRACYGCYRSDDRFLALAPMCHGAGLVFALASIYFGGYIKLMDDFNAELVLQLLKEKAINGVFMVPTHLHSILELPETLRKRLSPFDNLRTIISNAAPLPQALKEKIIDYFGEGLLHESYGSTEGGIVSNLQPVDQMRKLKCVGQPFPETEISIRTKEGGNCAMGEVGELFSRSPYLFSGYWQRDADTAEAFHDGWCTVGDLARYDEEGYIYIVDRKKDMIISGGINIYPREIEEVLVRHPEIYDAAVVGEPDPKWGERIKAYIVTRNNTPVENTELKLFCGKYLAKFKVPSEFESITELPRNASGKVLKTKLRAG